MEEKEKKKKNNRQLQSEESSSSNYYLQEIYHDENSYYNSKLLPCGRRNDDGVDVTSPMSSTSTMENNYSFSDTRLPVIIGWKVTGKRGRDPHGEAAVVVNKEDCTINGGSKEDDLFMRLNKMRNTDIPVNKIKLVNKKYADPTVEVKSSLASSCSDDEKSADPTVTVIEVKAPAPAPAQTTKTTTNSSSDDEKTGDPIMVVEVKAPAPATATSTNSSSDDEKSGDPTVVEVKALAPATTTDPTVVEVKVERSKDPTVVDEVKAKALVKKRSNEKVHECTICGKCYETGRALGGHKSSHKIRVKREDDNRTRGLLIKKENIISEEDHQLHKHGCDVCNKMFDTQKALKMHQRSHHDDEYSKKVVVFDLNHEPDDDIIYIAESQYIYNIPS